MNKSILVILLCLNAWSIQSNAMGFHSSPAVVTDCPHDAQDPFSYEARMPGGPHKGMCIDTNKYRSVQRLTRGERISFGLNPDDQSIEALANFQHDGKFWIAEIPKNNIQGIIFQLIVLRDFKKDILGLDLEKKIYHGQLRFVMKDPNQGIHLINQVTHEEMFLKGDFVYALIGLRAVGHDETFNAVHGLEGLYASSYTLGSLQQQAQWAFDDKENVEQYRLDLNQAQVLRILTATVDIGTKYKITKLYNSAYSSCLNVAFSALNKGLGHQQSDLLERVNETLNPIDTMTSMKLIRSEKQNRLQDLLQSDLQ